MIREVIEFTPEIYQKIVARTNNTSFSESVLTLVQVGLALLEKEEKEKSEYVSFDEFYRLVKENIAKTMRIPRKLVDEAFKERR